MKCFHYFIRYILTSSHSSGHPLYYYRCLGNKCLILKQTAVITKDTIIEMYSLNFLVMKFDHQLSNQIFVFQSILFYLAFIQLFSVFHIHIFLFFLHHEFIKPILK